MTIGGIDDCRWPDEPPKDEEEELDLSDPVIQKLIQAAVEVFQHPEYDFLNAVQVSAIARKAGVPEATARKYLKVQQLRNGLIRYLLDPSSSGVSNWDDRAFAHIEDAYRDRTSSLGHDVEKIINWAVELNRTDPLVRTQFRLWTYMPNSDLISSGLAELYGQWYEVVRHVINEFLVTHSSEVRLRSNWISNHDLAVTAMVIAEAYSMHAEIHDQNSGSGFPALSAELPGRVFKTILASVLEFNGDEEEFFVDRVYRRIDEARRAGRAGADPVVPGQRPWNADSTPPDRDP